MGAILPERYLLCQERLGEELVVMGIELGFVESKARDLGSDRGCRFVVSE